VTPYDNALAFMEERVTAIRAGTAPECVWLLEHPALYTAGTSAKAADLLDPRFPVFQTGRGGEYTYHGPGQRVAYVMLDLKRRQAEPDIKTYVWQLEEWIIRTLAHFGVAGLRIPGKVGIWGCGGAADDKPLKIAAIGVRIRHWVAYHGISINVNPDLSHFDGIVPCGIRDHGVTSFHDLQKSILMSELDAVLQKEFEGVFGSD
jgi:lipoyl(octanoyl) transferase